MGSWNSTSRSRSGAAPWSGHGPRRLRAGSLRTRADHDDSSRGSGGGLAVLHAGDEPSLRQELSFPLTGAVIGLVGG